MRPPHRPSRPAGWAVPLAVAAVAVGGAVAVHVNRRRRTGRPVPAPQTDVRPPGAARPDPPLPARPAAAGTPAASRSLLRMAVGAAAVVVLALAVVVATRPADTDRTVTPHLVRTLSPGPSGGYLEVTVPGPVGRTERVALTGDDGARAEVGIGKVSDPQTEFPGFSDYLGQRHVVFTVHIHNTGRVWIGTRLDPGAWVLDAGGTNYRSNEMLSGAAGPYGSTDPRLNPAWQLHPDWQVDRYLGFTVPRDARLARLHIALPMGAATPTAEWNL